MANSQLGQVPIVVMASNRPYYLYRMLRSLLQADGVNASMVSVFIDGFYDEPLMVSRLFNLRAIQQRPLGKRSARISHHYKSSLTTTFDKLFPQAKHAIIFEEDLDIARDALIYFNQTLPLLESDSSLYCVSAWNDQGYEHSAGNKSLLYRIETMPGLGWMMSRELYKQELESQWPSFERQHDWDMWIRTNEVRKARECIIPDISRTFHFGSTGTNINSYFQKQYFSKHAFSLDTSSSDRNGLRAAEARVEFANLDEMTSAAYERLVENLVRNARVVGLDEPPFQRQQQQLANNHSNYYQQLTQTTTTSQQLCALANNIDHHLLASSRLSELAKSSNLPSTEARRRSDSKNKRSSSSSRDEQQQVIYIDMIDEHDFSTWLKLAKCWNIWDLDARGQHKSAWRFFIAGKPTIVVGSPASVYSRFKPNHLIPFKLT